MTWREEAGPIITRVLAETKGKTETEIRAALAAAYPFGPHNGQGYKTWLDEIRKQRGIRGTRESR